MFNFLAIFGYLVWDFLEAKSPQRTSLKFIIFYKGIIATIMLAIALISA
jgi:hypothetical protein